MRWILHIGAPKTGSTAVQKFLFENRQKLLERRILYPDASLRGYGHHDLAFLLAGGYPEWAVPQQRSLQDLSDDLSRTARCGDADVVVLSSENFYLYPRPVELFRLLQSAGLRDGDSIRVVCYLRRQDEAHVSWYNQTVKAQGNPSCFAASVQRAHALWNYAERLRPWQSTFGAAAILVRDYAPFATASGDIRADFIDIIGATRADFDLPPGRINERINRDILDFQRWVNRLPLSSRQKRRYHKQLIALTSATADQGIFDDSSFLSSRQRSDLVRSYDESNAEVARTFLDRAQLFEPLSEQPDAPSARQGLTPKKIAVIARWLLTHRSA